MRMIAGFSRGPACDRSVRRQRNALPEVALLRRCDARTRHIASPARRPPSQDSARLLCRTNNRDKLVARSDARSTMDGRRQQMRHFHLNAGVIGEPHCRSVAFRAAACATADTTARTREDRHAATANTRRRPYAAHAPSVFSLRQARHARRLWLRRVYLLRVGWV
jgi:hypothetical protein